MGETEILSAGPDREPWSIKRKTVLGMGLAALMTVTGSTAYQYNRLQKVLTPEEQRAQASIQETFATMTTGDIMECRVSGPPIAKAVEWPFVGPVIDERAHIPGVSVSVLVEPGELGESKEVQSRAGRYGAAITWQSLQLESRVRSISMPRTKPAITESQKATERHDINSTVYAYLVPFHRTESLRVNIPIHGTSDAKAFVDIVPVVGGLRLVEVAHGDLEITPTSVERELIGEPCISLSVLTRGEQIRGVSILRYE